MNLIRVVEYVLGHVTANIINSILILGGKKFSGRDKIIQMINDYIFASINSLSTITNRLNGKDKIKTYFKDLGEYVGKNSIHLEDKIRFQKFFCDTFGKICKENPYFICKTDKEKKEFSDIFNNGLENGFRERVILILNQTCQIKYQIK